MINCNYEISVGIRICEAFFTVVHAPELPGSVNRLGVETIQKYSKRAA